MGQIGASDDAVAFRSLCRALGPERLVIHFRARNEGKMCVVDCIV